MDDQAENLIQKMLVMNPKNRITAAEYNFFLFLAC